MPSVRKLLKDPPTPDTVFDLSDDDEDHDVPASLRHSRVSGRDLTLTKEQEEGWVAFWDKHCRCIFFVYATSKARWLVYIERLACLHMVARDTIDGTSINSTIAQRSGHKFVILSCWFCPSEGIEYSFYPEDSGMLAIMPTRNGEEDRSELQVFDNSKSIVLCAVSASGGPLNRSKS